MKTLVTFLFVLNITFGAFAQDTINIMIATGGHKFNRESFFGMFESFENITFEEAIQPKANMLIENGLIDQFDLLVFYDMYDSITTRQKEAYIKLLKRGKPMLFLHHSLVSYQNWPGFTRIIGGKYNQVDSMKVLSNYEHDVNIPIQIIDKKHPITAGLKDFILFDETYGKCTIMKNVYPLLSTNHSNSMAYLAWINRCLNTDVVYIQSGHGPSAYNDPNFRKLLIQAIRWSASNQK